MADEKGRRAVRLETVTEAWDLVEIDGQEFKVGPLPHAELGVVSRIVARLAESPMETVSDRLEGLPDAERKAIFAEARKAARVWVPPSLNTYAAHELILNDPEVSRRMFDVALRVHQPDLADADLDRLWAKLARSGFVTLLQMCLETYDPKAILAGRRTRTTEEQTRIDAELERERTEEGYTADPVVVALASQTMRNDEREALEEQLRLQESLGPLLSPFRWITV